MKTFEEYYKEYLLFKKMRLKETSLKSVTSRFNSYILPYFAKLSINEITTQTYLQWQMEIEKKPLRYGYKKTLHYAISTFYEYLITFKGFQYNIPKQVGNFKNNDIPKELNFYTLEEFKKFTYVFEEQDIIYKHFFHFQFFTGAREGETLALQFKDFSNGILFINKTISKELINGKKLISFPKTKNSVRKIALDESTCRVIQELKQIYTEKYGYFKDTFFIFGGVRSISVSMIQRRLIKYSKKANLKKIRIHDFRHSHATLLLQLGVPIAEISKRLGHSDINITFNTYIHLTSEYEKRARNALNSITQNLI